MTAQTANFCPAPNHPKTIHLVYKKNPLLKGDTITKLILVAFFAITFFFFKTPKNCFFFSFTVFPDFIIFFFKSTLKNSFMHHLKKGNKISKKKQVSEGLKLSNLRILIKLKCAWLGWGVNRPIRKWLKALGGRLPKRCGFKDCPEKCQTPLVTGSPGLNKELIDIDCE